MPRKETTERAKKALRSGKRPSTAAGEFVHEEIEHVREGKHGARSTRQAIAIGLSKARRAGIPVKPPGRGQASEKTRHSARQATPAAKRRRPTSRKRSQASLRALKREGHSAASSTALSRQAKAAATRRRNRTHGRKTSASKSGTAKRTRSRSAT